jgi:hypothetical protein
MLRHRPRERLARRRSQVPWVRRIPLRPPPVVGNVPTFIDIRAVRRGVRVKGRRKDKGVAILDYALGNRPSTGEGEVGGRLCPQRARRQLVPVIEGVRSRAAEAGVARSGSHLPGRALQ